MGGVWTHVLPWSWTLHVERYGFCFLLSHLFLPAVGLRILRLCGLGRVGVGIAGGCSLVALGE